METIDGVDPNKVDWLRAHVPRQEAAALFLLLTELSQPEAAQLLPSYFYADPSYYYLQSQPGLFEKIEGFVHGQLTRRPPAGDAGILHVAYLVANIRAAIVEVFANVPYYRYTFTGQPLRLTPAAPPENEVHLELNFEAARSLLEALSTSNAAPATLLPWLDREPFKALIQHHSADFYPIVVTREALAQNVAWASGDTPLDRLYRYAFPLGLLHFAEVRSNLKAYRQLLDTLQTHEARIIAHVKSSILPYLPADIRFSRTVHFLFADGADGWVSGDVAAIDLEYFKDDYDTLLKLLVHETYHAAQHAARQAPLPSYEDQRLRLFVNVLESVYGEGTATYVAPPQEKTDAEYARAVAEGRELLERIRGELFDAETWDLEAVRALHNRGVQGAGPFYWLGKEMSRVIVEALGAETLAETVRQGGVSFFRTYFKAVSQTPHAEPLFGAAFVEALKAL